MQTNVFDKIEGGPPPLRIVRKTIEAMVEDLGVERTVCLSLRYVCEPHQFIPLFGEMVGTIVDYYGVTPPEAVYSAVEFFRYFSEAITIGEDEAKFLLETKVTSVDFHPDYISINTQFSEEEYERALEKDRPSSPEE